MRLEAGDRGRRRVVAGAALIIAFTIVGEMCSIKNSRQIVTVNGKPSSIKSKEAREYERAALLQIPVQARQQLIGPVKVTVRAFYASQKKDLDCELLFDCLQNRYKKIKGSLTKKAEGEYVYGPSERILVQKGVVVNDRQFRTKLLFWALDKANPRAEIEIEPMQAQQADLLGEELPPDEADDEDGDPPF